MVGITIFNQTDKSEAATIIGNKIYNYSYETALGGTTSGRGFWTYDTNANKIFLDIYYQDATITNTINRYALSGWVHIGSDDYFLTPTDKTKTLATGIFHVQDKNKNMTRFGFSYDGKLLHGFHKIDDNYYFMDSKGIVQTNTWKTVNNKYYYHLQHFH